MKRVLTILISCLLIQTLVADPSLEINDKDYLEMPGLNVFAFTALYPEGHQGGIDIIQHGKRVATNGNLFFQPTPGQWQPVPKLVNKEVDKKKDVIVATLQYPDSSRMAPGFNPMIYPDIKFSYDINIISEGDYFRVTVDLNEPLPEKYIGKLGFNLELFPGYLFEKGYYMDGEPGNFPRYANSSVEVDEDGEYEAVPMAQGSQLTIAPNNKYYRMSIESKKGELKLIDGRVKHNNGWFVVRSLIPAGATENAIEWIIKPNTVKGWQYEPVVHTSQLGYHPEQKKVAVIELDKRNRSRKKVEIQRVLSDGEYKTVEKIKPEKYQGEFLRYNYLQADFSHIKKKGIYVVQYGKYKSGHFQIREDIYADKAWQPVLEYFLPVQMCHMKVFEKYRVWHGRCHLDDALMAPENINHFDGYSHAKTAEGFEEFEHVEGLDKGGWHDAGDYDFRVESQLGTVLKLALAYEEFDIDYDQTLIDQESQIVEIHRPDGKPDALQQIEHGLLTILGGYRQFDKLYRGIICPTLRQYVLLGDAASMTDNEVFDGKVDKDIEGLWYMKVENQYSKHYHPQMRKDMRKEYVEKLDDRMVFMDDNPGRQLLGVSGLAAASRVMQDYNPDLADECLQTAKALWEQNKDAEGRWATIAKLQALADLILTTGNDKYQRALTDMQPVIIENLDNCAWIIARVISEIDDQEFVEKINKNIPAAKEEIMKDADNPFGIPYEPQIWGAGWAIQSFGVEHYFLHKAWPEVFSKEPMLNALNFVLGNHPGENTVSFASNIGTKSATVAYGVNRADWSFIPGGVCSGTNLIRPDFPELKVWPFMWQQTEYVLGGGSTNYMFLVLGADEILNE